MSSAAVLAPPLPRRRPGGRAAAGGFEAALTELAAERATGTLHGPQGGVQLADGAVLGAESPAAPDVRELLTGCGRLPAHAWEEYLGYGGTPDEMLVRAGLVGRGELELCRATAVLDAAYLALGQPAGPLHFTPGGTARTLLPRPLSVSVLRAAMARRRALLDRIWPWARLDGAVLSRCSEQWPADCPEGRRAVLAAVDGSRTPPDIARLLGRSVYGVLLDVRQSAAAGLLDTAEPTHAQDTCAQDTRAGDTRAEVRTDPLAVAAPPPTIPQDSADPDIALLLRLRAALEARL